MQTLRDKLLKAGLVSEEQAKKAESSPPAKAPGPRHASPRPPSGPRTEAQRPQAASSRPAPSSAQRPPPGRPTGGRPPAGRPGPGRPPLGPLKNRLGESPLPKLPPLPGSKAHQRIESKKQQEQDRQLRELVLHHQVPLDVGATVFYFMTRKGKLRRLELKEEQAKLIESGVLGVVERPEPAQIEHSLVPSDIAEKMFALSPKAVRFLNRPEAPIGFMNDDELKVQQDKEASAQAEEPAPEAAEAPAEASAAPDEPAP